MVHTQAFEGIDKRNQRFLRPEVPLHSISTKLEDHIQKEIKTGGRVGDAMSRLNHKQGVDMLEEDVESVVDFNRVNRSASVV